MAAGPGSSRVSTPTLSALVAVHGEEEILVDCLGRLSFADAIVVVLDGCTDGSEEIAGRYTDRLMEGAWSLQGDRRNAGIGFRAGEWIRHGWGGNFGKNAYPVLSHLKARLEEPGR